MPAKPDRVLIGEIGRPQGLNGEVRIRSFTAEPGAIADYGPLEDETGTRRFEIESLRVTPKALTARIKGVASRGAAEALTGTKLYVPRSRLPEQEDEWYHSDLIGLSAMDQDGLAVGAVIAVHNFGAGDLLEIRPASGGATLLIPFTRDTVPEVDVEGGWLKVVPPEGLLE
ncbi:MAG TPA: ribosome maturation factor RimM [Methyloceanibacter sp.]|nr:ribosome maturation factor RimM [Methyloceanibacter sp.]